MNFLQRNKISFSLQILNLAIVIFLAKFEKSVFAADTADDLVKRADEVRNPSDSFSMTIDLVTDSRVTKFEVLIKGNEKTLVRTLEPPRDRGRNMLMLKENMWAYIPNLKRSVRVSLSQKLSGQAANGDISRTRWANDYSAILESEDAKQRVLLLSSQKEGLTYEKIRVRIGRENSFPLSADYLTKSGQALKKAEFLNYRMLAGKMRPSVIKISDALKPSEISEIRVLSMTPKTFPEALFSQSNLQ
jgi:outer membrane lipoprotein-sorting protein